MLYLLFRLPQVSDMICLQRVFRLGRDTPLVCHGRIIRSCNWVNAALLTAGALSSGTLGGRSKDIDRGELARPVQQPERIESRFDSQQSADA